MNNQQLTRRSIPNLSNCSSISLANTEAPAPPSLPFYFRCKKFLIECLPGQTATASLLLQLVGITAGAAVATFSAIKFTNAYEEKPYHTGQEAEQVFFALIALGNSLNVLCVEAGRVVVKEVKNCFFTAASPVASEENSCLKLCGKAVKVTAVLALEMLVAITSGYLGMYLAEEQAVEQSLVLNLYLGNIVGVATGFAALKTVVGGVHTLWQQSKNWWYGASAEEKLPIKDERFSVQRQEPWWQAVGANNRNTSTFLDTILSEEEEPFAGAATQSTDTLSLGSSDADEAYSWRKFSQGQF